MDKNEIIGLILIGGGIASLVLAWLGFRAKISLDWFQRYHQAPTPKENPDFRFESRAYGWGSLLTGVMGVLLGSYLLFERGWMKRALIVGIPVFVVAQILVGVAVVKKQNKRSRHQKKHTVSPNKSDTDDEFSITEVRVGALRGPILIMGALFVFSALGLLATVVWKIPKEYVDPGFIALAAIPWPILQLLNRLIPKRKFSYRGGVFTIVRGGRVDTFRRETVRKVDTDHPVLPDVVKFYLTGRREPVGIPMAGFRPDDRFGLPAKILRIVGAEITGQERQAFDDIHDFS